MPNANILTNGKYQTFGAGLQTPPRVRYYGQSPWPGLKPRPASQEVPVFVHTIFAAPTANVGVSIIVSAVPVAEVAPDVTLMTPAVTDVIAVIFLDTAIVGMPFEPALQFVNARRSL